MQVPSTYKAPVLNIINSAPFLSAELFIYARQKGTYA